MTAPSLARILTDSHVFSSEPFTVIDVGCTGGIFEHALEFVPDLKAVGFDPIVEEIERLQNNGPAPGVIFECALVSEPGWQRPLLRKSPSVFERSSAAAYEAHHAFDYSREIFNSGQDITLTSRTLRLEDWLRDHDDWTVDLLKVDTDGSDISVLRSLGGRLGEPLAIHIEMNFDGDLGADSNIFSRVFDTLLEAGFRLFSLEPTKYAKATLPRPFEWSIPAQTVGGQVMQGDALFCKDLAVEGNDSAVRLLKLACIFDLFNLQDCAAELIENHADHLSSDVDVAATMDLLALRSEIAQPLGEIHDLFKRDRGAAFFPPNETGSTQGSEGSNGPTALPLREALEVGGSVIPVGTTASVQVLGDGWWAPEASGTWTSAYSAGLHLRCPEPIPARSAIVLSAWRLNANDLAGTVTMVANGQVLPLDSTDNDTLAFLVETEIPTGELELMIHAWPLQRPSDLHDTADDRLVGVHVRSVSARLGIPTP